MPITVVFETHAISEDNELGVASGWSHSRLSEQGRRQAGELGERRRDDGIAAVFSSDLRRAVETADIAFASGTPPILLDWRLRECDYGELTGEPADRVAAEVKSHIDDPFPRGESYRDVVVRVARFVDDLFLRWDGSRIVLIGHAATRWSLQHLVDGEDLDEVVGAPFEWQPGWKYVVRAPVGVG